MPASVKTELGDLPQWNLNDLYPGMKSDAFLADYNSAVPASAAFEETYKGKLASLSGDELAEAIHAYEALGEVGGRMMSYAGLIYAATLRIRPMPSFTGTCRNG